MSEVRVDGTAMVESADAATVEAGCDGACWFHDGDVLLVSIRAASAKRIEVR